MSTLELLVAAAIIVLCVLIIYYISKPLRNKARSAAAERMYQASAGDNDIYAQGVINTVNNMENPTPMDQFLRGRVRFTNILGGREGLLRRRNRRNINPGDLAAVRFTGGDYANFLLDVIGGRALIEPAQTLFMIGQTEDFNEQILRGLNFEDIEFAHIIDTAAPIARAATVAERIENTMKDAENKTVAVNNYFEDAAKMVNDPQNVHDTKLNNDLRASLNIIEATSPSIKPADSIKEIEDYIKSKYTGSEERKINALRTLQTLREHPTSIVTFNKNDDEILDSVWRRSKEERNRPHSALIKEAVADALADSIENGFPVCANGRAARILNSLTLLDYNPRVGNARTYEAYKNQIFHDVNELINSKISAAADSQDPELAAVGKSYEDVSIEAPSEAVEKFKDAVKSDINEYLQTYKDKLAAAEIENLKIECHAAVI